LPEHDSGDSLETKAMKAKKKAAKKTAKKTAKKKKK
jgi:hypothetical protein